MEYGSQQHTEAITLEDILASFAESLRPQPFRPVMIMVPHTITSEQLEELRNKFEGKNG